MAIGTPHIIQEYPSKIFPDMCDTVFGDTPDLKLLFDISPALSKGEAEGFLNYVKDCMTPVPIDPDFFWILFCRHTGLNEMAAEALARFHPDPMALEGWKYGQLLSAKMMVARERALFWQYRTAAWELLRASLRRKPRAPEDDLHILNAGLQLVSANLMDIPHHLYFPLPLCYRKYGLALLVRLEYTILMLAFRIFCWHREKRWSGFKEMASSIVQEAQLRALAIDVRVCQAFQAKFLQHICMNRLEKLQDEAKTSGNYITATSVFKYLNRLFPNSDYETNVDRAISLSNDISTDSIMKRDCGNYEDGFKAAIHNGNTLNIIKNLLGMAYKTYLSGETPPLSEEKQEILFSRMRDVQSKHLSKAFAYICRKYFGRTAFYRNKKLTIL